MKPPWERGHPPHLRHHVDSHARGLRVLAAEVNCVASAQVPGLERGDGDHAGSKIGERGR